MESTLLATSTTMSILTLSKALNSNSRTPLVSQLHRHFSSVSRPSRLACARLIRAEFLSLNRFGSISLSRGLGAVDLRLAVKNHLPQCLGSSDVASFASGGGGFAGKNGPGGNGGGGGGGDGEAKPAAASAAGGGEVSALSSDVIILDVGGMTCGGCAASVKRILESQAQVSSASVNLTAETALVWPVSEATVVPDWKKQLGEVLANHLTSCGFTSKLRGQGANEEDNSS